MKRRTDLKLYDLCTAIERTSGSTKEVADSLGVTVKTVDRRLTRLRELGIDIPRTQDFAEDIHTAKLPGPLEFVLDKLDRLFGMRPYPMPSTLSEEEQEDILETYQDLLTCQIDHWPYHYFDDSRYREEKLRVIIPYAVEQVIKRPFKDICTKHIDDARLSNPKNKYCRGSPYQFLTIAYPWLRQWEVGRVKGIWKGKAGEKRMKEAITWLVEEVLPYPFEEIPAKISRNDFKRHNLDGFSNSPASGSLPTKRSISCIPENSHPHSSRENSENGPDAKGRPGHDGRRDASSSTN